jgi:hypothetical protein
MRLERRANERLPFGRKLTCAIRPNPAVKVWSQTRFATEGAQCPQNLNQPCHYSPSCCLGSSQSRPWLVARILTQKWRHPPPLQRTAERTVEKNRRGPFGCYRVRDVQRTPSMSSLDPGMTPNNPTNEVGGRVQFRRVWAGQRDLLPNLPFLAGGRTAHTLRTCSGWGKSDPPPSPPVSQKPTAEPPRLRRASTRRSPKSSAEKGSCQVPAADHQIVPEKFAPPKSGPLQANSRCDPPASPISNDGLLATLHGPGNGGRMRMRRLSTTTSRPTRFFRRSWCARNRSTSSRTSATVASSGRSTMTSPKYFEGG